MSKWNDSDTPLAYLITFRTYGTWLHGDERGSTSRHHNVYGTPKLRPEPNWLNTNKSRLKREPVVLDAAMRAIVERAIRETCDFRGWKLYAINVRTNHGHSVIYAENQKPELVLNALKANSTRLLRSSRAWDGDKSPWSDKGSTRYIWTSESLERACYYVKYGQGDELPDLD
ncbi:transposase [soil metagenome]